MLKIVQKEDQILREIAQNVETKLFGTAKLKKIISDMSRALVREDDGVALAAPQIGLSLRIFVISGKIFTPDDKGKNKPDLIFINPEISKLSKEKMAVEEGCLSVRWIYGEVKRAVKATITAYDVNGKKFTRSSSGLLAQIFQHEIDHLNGVLFIDKTKELKKYQPEVKK